MDLVEQFELTYKEEKYAYIDNKQDITIVFFTGAIDKYVCITWFSENLKYNYLFVKDPSFNSYKKSKIIERVHDECSTHRCIFIGYSMGGVCAILHGIKQKVIGIIIYDFTPWGCYTWDDFLKDIENLEMSPDTVLYNVVSNTEDLDKQFSTIQKLIKRSKYISEILDGTVHLSFVHSYESLCNILDHILIVNRNIIENRYTNIKHYVK